MKRILAIAAAAILATAVTACGSTGSTISVGGNPAPGQPPGAGNPPGISTTAAVYTAGWLIKVANQTGQPFNFGNWALVFYDASGNELGSLHYSTEVVYSNDPAGSSASSPLTMTGCAQLIMPGQELACAGVFPAGTTAPAGTHSAIVADVAPASP